MTCLKGMKCQFVLLAATFIAPGQITALLMPTKKRLEKMISEVFPTESTVRFALSFFVISALYIIFYTLYIIFIFFFIYTHI